VETCLDRNRTPVFLLQTKGDHLKRALVLAAITAAAFVPGKTPAHAAEIQCDRGIAPIAGFEPAELADRTQVRYPASGEQNWSEGWVLLNFTVAKDGTVQDLIPTDAMGAKAFVERTVRTFKGWRYKPAKRNGAPVDQHGTEFIFEYRMEGVEERSAVHREFIQRYEQARSLIRQKKYTEAIQLLENAMRLRTNLYESAMASFALAVAHGQLKDWRAALFHIRRATVGEGGFLEPAVKANALALQVQLETDDGNYKDAICAYKLLLKANPAGDPEAAKIIGQIEAVLKNPAPVAVQGRLAANPAVEGPAVWTHPLLRAKFHFAQIQGDAKSFRLVCTGTVFEAAIDAETEWSVPTAAGECTLRVEGAPGAAFHLVETW
jgi:TonB family protein